MQEISSIKERPWATCKILHIFLSLHFCFKTSIQTSPHIVNQQVVFQRTFSLGEVYFSYGIFLAQAHRLNPSIYNEIFKPHRVESPKASAIRFYCTLQCLSTGFWLYESDYLAIIFVFTSNHFPATRAKPGTS